MQRIGGEYTVQDPNGNAVPYGTVTVYPAGSATPSVVYPATGSATPTVPMANPITADAYGRWQCALPDGRYDLTFSGGSFPSYTLPNICVFDNTITYPSPMLGTVTSVQMAAPAEFTVTGGPVTGTGTLTLAYGSWAASKLIIAPTGGGTPTLRALVLADLPAHGPAAATYGSVTQTPVLTVNAQGIVTGIANTTIAPVWTSVTSKPTTMSGYAITDGVRVIYRQTSATSVYNTAVKTSLVGTGVGTTTIGANELVAGSTIRVKVTGVMGGGSGDTLILELKLGTYVLMTLPAQALGVNATTGVAFDIEATYTVRSAGAPGSGVGQILLRYRGSSVNGAMWPPAGITGVSSIDTTLSGAVDLLAQWGAAGASTGFTIHTLQVFVEA